MAGMFVNAWRSGIEATSHRVGDWVRGLPGPDRAPAGQSQVTWLPDGTRALVYPMPRSGGAALAAGLGELSPASRYQRFLSSRERFTASELEFLTNCDGVDHIALVLAVRQGWRTRPVAVARSIRDASDPELAEVAIAVADRWQGRGVGGVLLGKLHAEAWNAGVRRWRAYMFAENTAMTRLLDRAGDLVSREFDGPGCLEAIYVLRTPPEPRVNPVRERSVAEWTPLIRLAGAATALLLVSASWLGWNWSHRPDTTDAAALD